MFWQILQKKDQQVEFGVHSLLLFSKHRSVWIVIASLYRDSFVMLRQSRGAKLLVGLGRQHLWG